MSTDDKASKPTSTHYELPTGAVAILEEILPLAQWYKDDPKQGVLITRAASALEALPDTAKRIKPEKDEEKDAFDDRFQAWGEPVLEFEWTDKQKDAVRSCVRFHMKQGALPVNANTVALLMLLGLNDE